MLGLDAHEAREPQRSRELEALGGRVAEIHRHDRAGTHEQPHDRLVDLASEPRDPHAYFGERAQLGEVELDARVEVPGVLGIEIGIAADESLVGVEQLVEGRDAIGATGLTRARAASARARSRGPRSAAARRRTHPPSRRARPP
jgi:hypothetical protein